MKHKGLIITALVFLVLLIRRQSQAATPQAVDLNAQQPAGAPVPTLADEQTGLLASILTALRGGSAPRPSTGTTGTSTGTGSSSSSSSSSSSTSGSSSGSSGSNSTLASRDWINQQALEGAAFTNALKQTGYGSQFGPIPSMSALWAALTGDTNFPVYGDAAKLEQMYLQ